MLCLYNHPVGGSESCHSRGEMDNVTTGEIYGGGAKVKESNPHGIGANGVGKDEPQGHEQHPCVEIHPPQERAGDENEGDCGEDERGVWESSGSTQY